jgi:hypothetical protein
MRSPDSTRRRLIGSAPSLPLAGMLGAATIAVGQSPQQGVVSIDIERTLRLDSKEVFEFASTRKESRTKKFLSYTPKAPRGFQPGYKRTSVVAKPEKRMLVGSLLRTYILTRSSGGPAEPMTVAVPVHTPVVITVVAHLFVRTGAEAREPEIIKAFEAYKYAEHGEPQDYAAPRLGPAGVSPGMFVILQGWRIDDDEGSNQVFYSQAEEALQALYSRPGKGNKFRVLAPNEMVPVTNHPGLVLPEENLKTKDFGTGGYSLRYVSQRPATEPPIDPPLKRDDQRELITAVEESLKLELNAIDCAKGFGVNYVPLAVLAAWPEFKVELRTAWIEIGCVKTEVPQPVLMTRTTRLVINGYYSEPTAKKFTQAAVDEITRCLVSSFAVAAVAGLAVCELATAVQVFRLFFDVCIEKLKEEFKKCLIPGLALLTVPDSKWKEVNI